MKRVLIALILCFIFSSEVQARKVMIITASGEDYSSDYIEATDECLYSISELYWAYAHAHKSNELVLMALVGADNELTQVSTGGFFEESGDAPKVADPAKSAPWITKRGESWSLVWELRSTKGKGRVIDAIEMTSGTCNP